MRSRVILFWQKLTRDEEKKEKYYPSLCLYRMSPRFKIIWHYYRHKGVTILAEQMITYAWYAHVALYSSQRTLSTVLIRGKNSVLYSSV